MEPEFPYNREFELLVQLAAELDKRMEFYHAVFNEENTTRKYLSLVSFTSASRYPIKVKLIYPRSRRYDNRVN